MIVKFVDDISLEEYENSMKTESVYVILFSEDRSSFDSKVIRGVTKSFYTHSAISLDNELTAVYEMKSDGMNKTNYKKFVIGKIPSERMITVYELKIRPEEKENLIYFLETMYKNKIKYDSNTIFSLKIFRNKGYFKSEEDYDKFVRESLNRDKYICTTLVISSLAYSSKEVYEYIYKNRYDPFRSIFNVIQNIPGLTPIYAYDMTTWKKYRI